MPSYSNKYKEFKITLFAAKELYDEGKITISEYENVVANIEIEYNKILSTQQEVEDSLEMDKIILKMLSPG